MSVTYDHQAIDAKWQQHWLENRTFRAEDGGEKPKYYVLDMFPYPSGAGLHVGHPEGYTATDIVCRYKRMRGFNAGTPSVCPRRTTPSRPAPTRRRPPG